MSECSHPTIPYQVVACSPRVWLFWTDAAGYVSSVELKHGYQIQFVKNRFFDVYTFYANVNALLPLN